MRLTELEPHWIGVLPGHAIGITFLCPHCRKTRLGVAFDVEIGEEKLEYVIGWIPLARIAKSISGFPVWHREGETFENLTLSPSIDVSTHGHWHGFITEGEVC